MLYIYLASALFIQPLLLPKQIVELKKTANSSDTLLTIFYGKPTRMHGFCSISTAAQENDFGA
jgi:hypothetical protein